MKNNFILIILLLIFFSGCSSNKSEEAIHLTPSNMAIELKLQKIVDSMYVLHPSTKGISVHIEAPNYRVSWNYATGWADSATSRKLASIDPALIASITKMYLSATILRLVEKGKIQLNQPISELLSKKRVDQLQNAGYDAHQITVAHLNSQTSGIYDYVNTELYQSRTTSEPSYVWNGNEQITLALQEEKSFNPGEKFEYSETNNLLLAQIIESQTGLSFFVAMRELLSYEKYNLNHTWFNWLEIAPENLAPLAHQFASEYNVDSYSMHPSFDLYGGGGIAATPEDVAKFTQLLFTGMLFDNSETKKLLLETVLTADSLNNDYYMGVAKTKLGKHTAYGHGGFWGTTIQYFPELNMSISIFLMERDEWPLYLEMLEQMADVIEAGK